MVTCDVQSGSSLSYRQVSLIYIGRPCLLKKKSLPPKFDDTLFPSTLPIHCTELSICMLASLPSLFLSPFFVSPSQTPIINYNQLCRTQLSVVCEFHSSNSLNKNSKTTGSGWLWFFSTLALWKTFHPSQTYFNIPVSILSIWLLREAMRKYCLWKHSLKIRA